MTTSPDHPAVAAARAFARSRLAFGPRHLLELVLALRRWDRTPAACLVAAAAAGPDRPFVIDERGTLTYGEADACTSAIAAALADDGVRPADTVAVMCRNHRGFAEIVLAASKLGANVVLLNTDFAGPQLAGVLGAHAPAAIVYDDEFDGLLTAAGAGATARRYLAWTGAGSETALDEIAARHAGRSVEPAETPGRVTILSSGTTGSPKGVERRGSTPLGPLTALLDRIPLRACETHVLAAPMFHGWGYLNLGLGLILSSTLVLRRRFDPEQTLALIERHRATAAPLVPVMLQRIMQLGPDVLDRHDVSSLRAIPLAGSAIPAGLAVNAMDRLGDVVYNIYGSTECALASVATPSDLRAAPGTAGRALAGTTVRILDRDFDPVPTGETGIVFVGSALASDGYTGGGAKQAVDGALSSGDLGHLDERGRLFIDGREDEMIVSGGENVYPGEVEDLLAGHPGILEASVVGVPDDEFGQRLAAFVVPAAGAALSADDVREHVRAHLARYKVPREVTFLDELPRNPSGKVLKRELSGVSAAPA